MIPRVGALHAVVGEDAAIMRIARIVAEGTNVDFSAIADVMSRHLLTVLKPIEFDIVPDDDGGIDVTTDNWTIHLESESGFLAIDGEPEDAAVYATARREVVHEEVEQAIAAADRELNGALSSLLEACGDPFTVDFATALRAYV
jgi:hypothetical protein